VALWGLLAGILWCWKHDLYNMFAGPIAVDQSKLCAINGPDELGAYYVQLEADHDQRWFASAFTQGREPYSYYGLLHFGGKLLLIQKPAEHEGNVYIGVLEPLTPYERDYLVERCREKNPGKELLPFRLDMTRPLWLWFCYFRLAPLVLVLSVAVVMTIRLFRQRFIIRYFQCEGWPRM
jgi:hypothetical protein